MLSATNRLFYVSSVRPQRPDTPVYLPMPQGGLAGVAQQVDAAVTTGAPSVTETTVAQALSVLQNPKK
jgi:hypothetical protein